MENLLNNLKSLLQKDERLVSEGELLKNKIIELAIKLDKGLIELLLTDKRMKEIFFTEIPSSSLRGAERRSNLVVFDKDKFIKFVSNKQFLPDSYTAFKNKIGLVDEKDEFISKKKEVVLSWPYKDCVLEGGMTKEDQKRDEIFWNEILAPDEISRLFDPKVFTNAKRIDKKGEHSLVSLRGAKATKQSPFKTDENGDIKDNLIIKGNNLLALHSLKKRFAGRVKLIYIDPPYNTGNDEFKYNDAFNHSTWLVFMKNRLEVARELLKEDGVIFISCDDNEQAYLKVLCDEIFRRENFVATLIRKSGIAPRLDAKYLATQHDYILCCSRNINEVIINRKISETKGFTNKDEYVKQRGKYRLNKLDRGSIHYSERLDYPIIAPDGQEVWPAGDPRDKKWTWRWSKNKVNWGIEKGYIVFKKNQENKWSVYYKEYELVDNKDNPRVRTNPYGTLIMDAYNEKGTAEINDLFSRRVFDYPKPVSLMKHLIKLASDKNAIILDFMAGTGTTAQAVLELNKEDGGNRQFILCEQLDYVDTITIPRVKKVIKKLGGGDFVYLELAKWNENFVEKIQKAKTKEELKNLWGTMKEKAFLSYKVDIKTVDKNAKDFEDLSIEDQKRFLLECLDKNHLYVNYSEIEDEEYEVSEEDKRINREFYKKA